VWCCEKGLVASRLVLEERWRMLAGQGYNLHTLLGLSIRDFRVMPRRTGIEHRIKETEKHSGREFE
jgi:hypothetical protein